MTRGWLPASPLRVRITKRKHDTESKEQGLHDIPHNSSIGKRSESGKHQESPGSVVPAKTRVVTLLDTLENGQSIPARSGRAESLQSALQDAPFPDVRG
jgi:hypothetical protein